MTTMSAAIALRSDFTGPDLRRLARRTEDARQARRLLALAEIYDGGSRRDAARVGDVGLQIIRDWVLRFNAEGPDGLIDRKAPGPEPRLTEAHRQALVTMIENGPIPAVHDVVRWRLIDLCQRLWEEFRVSVARQTLGRELRALGYRKLSARPRHHAQAAGAIEHFKKPVAGRQPACGGRNGGATLALEESGRLLSGGDNPVKKRGPWAVAHLRVVTPSRRSRSGS
jgi:putative transposase